VKRTLDVAVSGAALLLLSPALLMAAFAVWLEDRGSPWFSGIRVGRDGRQFRMRKFRSMRTDAWKSGVNSTAAGDCRITCIGRWLRRSKLDELPQLWNVVAGDMSLVGPRPQVPADASLYTVEERGMLALRPGITDLASIVFADEGEILAGSADPDLLYNQIIRPWKSRLALLYVQRRSMLIDLRIVGLTLIGLLSREHALLGVSQILEQWGADPKLCEVARRTAALPAYPPPGAEEVVARYHVMSA
jgi:lipopolysaccharide/colanic/teichoic acid biosynthesis glycosyltransferase